MEDSHELHFQKMAHSIPLFKALQPKVVKSWADYSSDDGGSSGDSIPTRMNLGELAALVCGAVENTDVPLNEGTAHHFKVGNMNADIMYRGNLVMVISFDKGHVIPFDKDKSESSSADDSEIVLFSSQNPTEEEWKVVTKARKGSRSTRKYHVFRDSANDPYMGDVVAVVHHLAEAITLVKKESWGHIYCPEENRVYDFPNPDNREERREFVPNHYYQDKWTHHRSDDAPSTEFYLFLEGPGAEYDWPSRFARVFTTMRDVRQAAKIFLLEKPQAWSHCYQPGKERTTFSINQKRLFKSTTDSPDVEYVRRFDAGGWATKG